MVARAPPRLVPPPRVLRALQWPAASATGMLQPLPPASLAVGGPVAEKSAGGAAGAAGPGDERRRDEVVMSVPPRQLLVDRRAGVHVRVFEQRAGHGGSGAQGGAEEEKEDARSRCRGCGEHDCCSGDGAGRLGRCRAGFASPPFVAGNNRLLRAHFRALTCAFLRPFERYFGITAAAGRRDVGGSAWIYNAPATMLEPFAPAAFLAQLALELREQEGARPQQPPPRWGGAASSPSSAAAAPPLAGAAAAASALAVLLECGAGAAGWIEIYSAFLKSPHFSPWFNGKRQAVTADIAETLRQLRAGVDGPVLMEGHDGALRAQERGALAERVRSCIAQERARSDADERLLRKMEEHLALVSGRR
jgi:hypothetical protein